MKNFFEYTGSELNNFAKALNWKRYYFELCFKYFNKKYDVLEIGAGIGSMSKLFIDNVEFKNWTCIEPDKENFIKLKENFVDLRSYKNINCYNYTVNDFLKTKNHYDLIFMADVLEHLENDKEILDKLFNKLRFGGKIIIFVPACQFLFSDFDKKIGHFRRYSFDTLFNILPNSSVILDSKYIDSVGFFASLMNKLIMKESSPSLKQILFWDRIIVPLSKVFDKLFSFKFGKNIYLTISKK